MKHVYLDYRCGAPMLQIMALGLHLAIGWQVQLTPRGWRRGKFIVHLSRQSKFCW